MTLKEDLEEVFGTDILEVLKDHKEFTQAFNKEQQSIILTVLKKIIKQQEFHDYDDKNPHDESLGKDIRELDEKLLNHRHDLGKTYTAKAEV